MALVKIKDKYQLTLPPAVREKAGISVGDLVEVEVAGEKITLTPKVAVDRKFIEQRIKEGIEDFKKGRVHGPYKTAPEAMRALRRRPK